MDALGIRAILIDESGWAEKPAIRIARMPSASIAASVSSIRPGPM